MNITRRPVTQKPRKAPPDPAYLRKVRAMPCRCCGRHGPNESHHCRDLPDDSEAHLYERIPGAARKSHDHDAIPLCVACHRMFHLNRTEFHAMAGKDYWYIAATRRAVRGEG